MSGVTDPGDIFFEDVPPKNKPAVKPEQNSLLGVMETTEEPEPVVRNTDLGNSLILLDAHAENFKYCPNLGWLSWTGSVWERDHLGTIQEAAKEVAEAMASRAELALMKAEKIEDAGAQKMAVAAATAELKWAKASQMKSRLTAMVELAATDPRVALAFDALDADPWILTCQNGTLHLRTGELRLSRREDLQTKAVDVTYLPDAQAPKWEAFLARVLPDEGTRSWAQRFCGYATSGKATEAVMPILFGAGANGKTVFIEVVRKILGDFAITVDPRLFLGRRHDEHPTEQAQLAGTRLVTTSETEHRKTFNESTVKLLTGADKISARYMRRDYFVFSPTFSIVMATNHKPIVQGQGHAIWRRLVLVPFEVTIPPEEQNKNLIEELVAEEAPGILRWLVEGGLAWQREGLQLPPSMAQATEKYRMESDIVGRFLNERCEADPSVETWRESSMELHRVFEDWRALHAENSPRLNETAFGTALTERGYKKAKPMINGVRCVMRLGIRLLTPVERTDAEELAEQLSEVVRTNPAGTKTTFGSVRSIKLD